ncbi:MAG: hypothetical protein AB1505_34745 [Candidatus Latescibacterota bacterium]
MADVLYSLLVFLCAVAGCVVGLRRTLVLVSAGLLGVAALHLPRWAEPMLIRLRWGAATQAMALGVQAIALVVLPIMTAVLLRRSSSALHLPWFASHAMGGVVGYVAGAALRRYLAT